MSPKHPGWAALADALAPGARVTRLRRLAGGGSSDTYDVELDRAPDRVVVKVFREGDDTAPLEWSRLKFAQRVPVAIPQPIAADLDATWFETPTLVMSRLPGRPDIAPEDSEAWVASLARVLTQLHDTPLDGVDHAVAQPPSAATWQPPSGPHDTLTSRAVTAVKSHLPSLKADHVFTHGDFNPSNILWQRGNVTGVVDWSAARLDARWSELAYCRGSVCLLLGPDVADDLADAYSDIVGYTSDELAVYDLMFVSSLHYTAQSLEADRHLGPVPTYDMAIAHLREQLRRAFKRLD